MSPTYTQMSKGARKAKPYHLSRSSAFEGAPHRKGIVYKVTTMSPRKPNSARRTFAKVRLLFNKKKLFAKIPGIGEHRLQNHALVFVRGHGPKDSPGINYHLVRGKCDFTSIEVYGRTNRRSKFGVKRPVAEPIKPIEKK
jgi:small subunit ribosomal protein S12